MPDTKLAPSLMELEFLKSNSLNLLDNGGFGAGQKYTGIVFNPATGTVVIDRWKCQFFTNTVQPTFSYQRAANGDRAHCIRLNCTVAGTGGLGDDRFAYQACLTGGTDFRGKQISVSMWMNSNTNTAGLELRYGTGLFVRTNHSGGGAWEYLTCTATIDSAYSQFSVAAFCSPAVTSDVWINDAMAVMGSVPVPYRPLSEAEDLMRCLRYYEKSYAIADAPGTNTATNLQYATGVVRNTNDVMTGTVHFKVQKASAPTVTLYTQTGTSGQWAWTNATSSKTNRVTTADVITTNGFNLRQMVTSADLFAEGHWVAEVA